MLSDPINYDVLSTDPTIESIRKLIGDDLLEKLSEDLGGGWFYITATPVETSPIAASIGLEAAQKLGKVYGGHRFAVPVKAGRNARIKRYLEEGMPITAISLKLHISPTTIRRFNAKLRDKNQADLFEK